LRPLPYAAADRLVGVWHDLPGVSIHKGNQTAATYYTYRKLARSLDDIGVYQSSAVNVSDPTDATEPRRVAAGIVTASVIHVLGVRPLVGRNFTAEEDAPKGPFVAMIGEGLWRSQYGGDRNVVGRTIQISGRTRTIVGVMPERFRF